MSARFDDPIYPAVPHLLAMQAPVVLDPGTDVEVQRLRARRAAQRIVDAEERVPVELPELVTLRDALAHPPEPQQWRIEGWLPKNGRVVFAAQAKAGKTTAAIGMVRSLVDGARFLGRDAVTPVEGRVAVIDLELSEWMLVDWYRRAGIQATDRVVLVPLRGRGASFDLRDPEVRTRWASQLRERDVTFLVLDCLRPLLDALGMDENREASALLVALDAMLIEAGITEAVVVHHMGHANARARGDSAILGWGEGQWNLLLGDDGTSGPRFIQGFGRGFDQPPVMLTLDPETLSLRIGGGSPYEVKFSAVVGVVLDALNCAGASVNAGTLEELGKAHGQTRKATRDAVNALVASGQVLKSKGASNATIYTLSEEFAGSPGFAARSPEIGQSSSPYVVAANWRTDEIEDQSLAANRSDVSDDGDPS